MLNLPHAILPVLLAALALATPLLSLIGAVCVALTVGMRRSGMLLALLALPLYVPVLIFGAGACDAAQAGCVHRAAALAGRGTGAGAGAGAAGLRGGIEDFAELMSVNVELYDCVDPFVL